MDVNTVYHGDALDVLRGLPDGAVDCVVTSPPYYGLRDYGVAGQIGLEPTPAEYVARMVAVFAEVRRVLADDGTAWVNIGDSYSGSGKGGNPDGSVWSGFVGNKDREAAAMPTSGQLYGLPPKSLLGIPWRLAFGLQDDGWILRSDIIWAKSNPMPESVRDRPTKSHEYVFLLSKSPRYWYDADAISERVDPRQLAHNLRYAKQYEVYDRRASTTGQPGNVNNVGIHARAAKETRNARTVWHISTEPTPFAHFATMPQKLVRRCILAGCKQGGVVLDPFFGSGTTGLVARSVGRKYVGIELNAEYVALAESRLSQPYTVPMFD